MKKYDFKQYMSEHNDKSKVKKYADWHQKNWDYKTDMKKSNQFEVFCKSNEFGFEDSKNIKYKHRNKNID